MNLQKYRHQQVAKLTPQVGVYALCDLDETPIYVGQSIDGIRARVQRHLTSARSDVIANRQLDIWEVAFVWAWPLQVVNIDEINQLEGYLIHQFHDSHPVLNGSLPKRPTSLVNVPERQVVQILPDEEVVRRRDPTLRLPRQAAQFANLLSYILEVKENPELKRTLRAHFERLERYYEEYMNK